MRIKAFDSARGIAALIVVIYHIPLVINIDQPDNNVYNIVRFPALFGEQAVYFFMALSGYVLTLASNKFGKINFFIWSGWRIFRLMPMYYFAYFAGFLLIKNSNIREVDLTHLYLFANELIYSGVNPPLWSLSVEILISIILFPLIQKRFKSKFIILMASAIFILSYSTNLWGLRAILRSVALFIVGMSVASLKIYLSRNQKRTMIILIFCWTFLIYIDKSILNSLLIPVNLIILLLLKNAETIIIVNKINQFLGKYSFSLYATHWISLNFINSYIVSFHWVLIYLLSCLFSIFISVCVGKIVELPLQKLSSLFINRFVH